jgi:hypothetical protein
MYQKPKLERFGTIRELTQLGPDSGADFTSVLGISAGCNAQDPASKFGCPSGRS